MTDSDSIQWSQIRDEACDRYGETPGAQLEQDVLEHFVDDPERVIRTIDRIATAHHKKPLGSPWAVLRADLNRTSLADITVDTTRSRDKLIDHAKTWIRNAGCYHDTWKAVAIELFGDDDETPTLEYLEQLDIITRDQPGRAYYDSLLQASITTTREHGPQPIPGDTHALLYTLRSDDNARSTLLAYWQEQRPRAIKAEHDFNEWNSQTAQGRQTIHAKALARARELQRLAEESSENEPPDFSVDDGIDDDLEPEPATVGADDDIDF